MEDKLQELTSLSQGNPFANVKEDEGEAEPFLDEFFDAVEGIRSEIRSMRAAVIELRDEYNSAVDRVDTRRKKKTAQEIDALVAKVNGMAMSVREKLKRIADELPTDEMNGLMTNERIMRNTHKSLLNEFLEVMQEYQQLQNNYNERTRGVVKAQVLVINPNATDADVERAIEMGPDQVLAMDRRRAAQESYDYIQARHNEILKIEKSLEEVHQLFLDMAVLVEEQSELIDRIAFQVTNVKRDIKIANEELREANKIQRKKCIIS